jgi:hypothetical protein
MGQTLAPTTATWEVEFGTDRCAESKDTVTDSSSALGSPVVPPDILVQYSLDKKGAGDGAGAAESQRCHWIFNFEVCEEG